MTNPIEQAIDRYNAVLAQPSGRMWAPVCLRQIEDAVDSKYGAGTWKRDIAPELTAEIVSGNRLDPATLLARLKESGPKPNVESGPTPSPSPASTAAASGLQSGPPSGDRKWLQGNAVLPQLDPSDNDALNKLDASIEALNQAWFVVDPAQAWFPDGARFPGTGSNLSTLGGTYDLAKSLIPQWRIAIDALLKTFEGSGEYLIEQQLTKIRDSITTLAGDAEASKDLHNAIARYGIAANDSFQQLRGEELAKRKDIADTAKELARSQMNLHLPHGIVVTDDAVDKADVTSYSSRGEFATIAPLPSSLSKAEEVARQGAAIAALGKQITTPAAVAQEVVNGNATETGAGNGTRLAAAPAGRAGAPAAAPGGRPGAPSPAGASKSASSDLSKLLSSLGTGGLGQQLPAAMAPAQQAAQQAAQPLAQAAQQAGKVPEELLKSLKGESPANQRHAGPDTPAARAADKDRTAATTATFAPPGPAAPKAVGTPGSDARPHQLDATGKPVDKEHTGKVDKDAVPLSKRSIKPFDLTVPANGHNVQVRSVPDPRLGEMMLNLADATAEKPCSVLDAAKASGMDLTSLGDPIDPADVQVGDAVIGAYQSGMYIGEGLVVTSTGLIEDLAEVLGDHGFISEVPLPDLPEDAPAVPEDKGAGPAADHAHTEAPATQNPPPAEQAARDVTSLPPNPPPAVPITPPPSAGPSAVPPQGPPAPLPAATAPPEQTPPPPPAPAGAPESTPAGPVPQQVTYQGHALG